MPIENLFDSSSHEQPHDTPPIEKAKDPKKKKKDPSTKASKKREVNGSFERDDKRIFNKFDLWFPDPLPKGGVSISGPERSFPSGMKYRGEYDKDKKMTGTGKVVYPCGRHIVEGHMKKGLFDGLVQVTHPSGLHYAGMMKRNKGNGYGRVTYPGADAVAGIFDFDKPSGFCHQTQRDGSVYYGHFEDMARHGVGLTKMAHSGHLYFGDFKHGVPDGYGWYEDSDRCYEGQFAGGLPNGFGELRVGKEKYIGPFSRGMMSGEGVWVYGNGDTFKGRFKEDRMDGSGVLFQKHDRSCYHVRVENGVARDVKQNDNTTSLSYKKVAESRPPRFKDVARMDLPLSAYNYFKDDPLRAALKAGVRRAKDGKTGPASSSKRRGNGSS